MDQMRSSLAILAACLLAGCVNANNAGEMPNGFPAFGHHHYWEPHLGRLLFGSNEPADHRHYWNPLTHRWVLDPEHVTPRDPLAQGWVVTTMQGEVYVSPKLQEAISR